MEHKANIQLSSKKWLKYLNLNQLLYRDAAVMVEKALFNHKPLFTSTSTFEKKIPLGLSFLCLFPA